MGTEWTWVVFVYGENFFLQEFVYLLFSIVSFNLFVLGSDDRRFCIFRHVVCLADNTQAIWVLKQPRPPCVLDGGKGCLRPSLEAERRDYKAFPLYKEE